MRIALDAEFTFALLDQFVEVLFFDTQHDFSEHHNKTPIGVPSEAFVARELCEPDDGSVVETQVEDRIHHPRHRDARTAAHRNEQRIGGVAESFSGALFEFAHRALDLRIEAAWIFAAVPVEIQARRGRNDEALRYRKPGARHLGKAGAFAAEEVDHRPVALVKKVDVLCRYGRRHVHHLHASGVVPQNSAPALQPRCAPGASNRAHGPLRSRLRACRNRR